MNRTQKSKKAIPVTGRGGLYGCEMFWRLPALHAGLALLKKLPVLFSATVRVNPGAMVRLEEFTENTEENLVEL
jgi:hypothetical protein